MEKTGREAVGQQTTAEFWLGSVKVQMPIRLSSDDVVEPIGCSHLEGKREVRPEDKYFEAVNIKSV